MFRQFLYNMPRMPVHGIYPGMPVNDAALHSECYVDLDTYLWFICFLYNPPHMNHLQAIHRASHARASTVQDEAGKAVCRTCGGCRPQKGGVIMGQRSGQAEWEEGAAALLEEEDWHGMVNWCQEWTKSNPEDTTAWLVLAVACTRLNRYNDAIDAYRQAIRIDPEFVGGWVDLSAVYYATGNRGAPLDVVRELRRLDPYRAHLLFTIMAPR